MRCKCASVVPRSSNPRARRPQETRRGLKKLAPAHSQPGSFYSYNMRKTSDSVVTKHVFKAGSNATTTESPPTQSSGPKQFCIANASTKHGTTIANHSSWLAAGCTKQRLAVTSQKTRSLECFGGGRDSGIEIVSESAQGSLLDLRNACCETSKATHG